MEEPQWIAITTFTQARYYLEQDYTIVFRLKDNSEGFIKKGNENKISISIQPKHGSYTEYIGSYDKIEGTMNEIGKSIDWEFWTIDGCYSINQPNNWKDKVADFIRKRSNEKY